MPNEAPIFLMILWIAHKGAIGRPAMINADSRKMPRIVLRRFSRTSDTPPRSRQSHSGECVRRSRCTYTSSDPQVLIHGRKAGVYLLKAFVCCVRGGAGL
ncbi:hypothetical protein FRC12_005404 [Ceratobasidium sp. 428]|nr:hypothetical protein FRC12_005404 [Ceratobasidium sp. 428]